MSRYIDAEYLKSKFKELSLDTNAYVSVASIVDVMPTADVAPVRHGKWLITNDSNKKRCSNCEVIHLIAQYPNGDANYCPNCGCKMNLESEANG